MGFHTVEQIVGQRACADESLIEILLNAGAGEQPIQQFLGQMFFGGCLPLPMLLVAVLRGCCCAIVMRLLDSSVQDADFSETRRKIQLSADVARASPTMVDAIRVGRWRERMFMRGIKHRQ